MTTYKLYYFPVTALGEPIRWLLSYGNKSFEDIRTNYDDWPSLKKDMPFGQMPVLEINGKRTWQHAAICRYLARELNLVGKNEWDAFQIDILVDTFNDFRLQIISYFYDKDRDRREKKKQKLLDETVPYFITRFEKIVGENGGYFVNKQLTWADLYYVAISDYFEHMLSTSLYEGKPQLTALRLKVLNIPAIKQWVDKRPASVYSS